MNKELHKLMLELEYKFDLELDEYWLLTNEQRDVLTNSLLKFFQGYMMSAPWAQDNLRYVVRNMVNEAERQDDYEKADIYNRLLVKLNRLTFFVP